MSWNICSVLRRSNSYLLPKGLYNSYLHSQILQRADKGYSVVSEVDGLHIGRDVEEPCGTIQKIPEEVGLHVAVKTQIVRGKREYTACNSVLVRYVKGFNVRDHPYTLICLIFRVIYSVIK